MSALQLIHHPADHSPPMSTVVPVVPVPIVVPVAMASVVAVRASVMAPLAAGGGGAFPMLFASFHAQMVFIQRLTTGE